MFSARPGVGATFASIHHRALSPSRLSGPLLAGLQMNRLPLAFVALIALAVLAATSPVQAQGDECSHGGAVLGVSALLHTYARGDSAAFEQTLGSLLTDPAYLTRCSGGYGETDEVVIEAAVRYFSHNGRTPEAIRVIDAFEPHLGDEARTRWLSARDALQSGGAWPPRRPSWDGRFSTTPVRGESDYARLVCGASEAEYGFVREGEKWYTLGLRSITVLVGYGWPYEAAIEHGLGFTSFADAAEDLCGG